MLQLQSNIKTMSSREIAESTGKMHKNVMRDIRSMYDGLKIDQGSELSFDHSGAKGRRIDFYELSYDLTMTLVSGYSVKLRYAIIKRWQELEQAQVPAIPQTYAAALLEAGRLAGVVEEQSAQIAIAAPKVAFVDNYVSSTGNKGFRQVCKLLKAKESEFREFLAIKKIMYLLNGEWAAYQGHIDAGRFHVSTGVSESLHAYTASKFTPKGVEWVAGLWAINNINKA